MNIKIETRGNLMVASGHNWTYERVGDLSVFTQTGKIPSLRAVKVLLKLHTRTMDIGVSIESLKSASDIFGDEHE